MQEEEAQHLCCSYANTVADIHRLKRDKRRGKSGETHQERASECLFEVDAESMIREAIVGRENTCVD